MNRERIRSEIEAFDDTESYKELMERPYFRRVKQEVESYMANLHLEGASILELGCGISEHAHRFSGKNMMIVTDITKSMLVRNDPASRKVLCDAQVLPFKDGSFDLIFLVGLLHHLTNQRMALSEAARLVKHKGKIFICDPSRYSINYVYYLLRILITKVFGLALVKKLIGCFSPDEKQLEPRAIDELFRIGYVKKKWTILSFRLPPLRLFKRLDIDVVLSRFFDRLPLFKNIGTFVCYEIIRE